MRDVLGKNQSRSDSLGDDIGCKASLPNISFLLARIADTLLLRVGSAFSSSLRDLQNDRGPPGGDREDPLGSPVNEVDDENVGI